MGRERSSTDQSAQSTSTTTATATAEEQEVNQLQLEQLRAQQPGQIATQGNALNLINQLLVGGDLPGFFGDLPGGISSEAIGTEASRVAQRAQPGFQSLGILDSGTAFEETAREVGQSVLFPAEQFNINNLLALLGQGLGAQGNAQGFNTAQSASLGARLAGLRPITTQGSSTVNIRNEAPNPFLQSFQQSLGQSLGSGSFGSGGSGGDAAAALAAGGCWVASELFGGWYEPKTCSARNFINNIAPKWFKNLYIKYGERIAKFISDKPILKIILKPIFEVFVWIGRR